jgi:hypothetical protein
MAKYKTADGKDLPRYDWLKLAADIPTTHPILGDLTRDGATFVPDNEDAQRAAHALVLAKTATPTAGPKDEPDVPRETADEMRAKSARLTSGVEEVHDERKAEPERIHFAKPLEPLPERPAVPEPKLAEPIPESVRPIVDPAPKAPKAPK